MRLRGSQGVTLVELLVALAIASILILGLLAAFQTTQRTAAVGEAREQIYQNARVALDIMSKEIGNAYIDSRRSDLVFVSADGLNGRGNSIIEFTPVPPAAGPYTPTVYGLGNTQVPFGVDPTGSRVANEEIRLYADETFGYPLYSVFSVKAIDDIYTLSPGPPDRIDFAAMTTNYANNTANLSKLMNIRYMVMTETFVDDVDNDGDGLVDENDNLGGVAGAGDLIPIEHREDYNPTTHKILALSLFQLHRATGVYYRYPARTMTDWDPSGTDENIGSYIYDVQFEFYGKIAVALKNDGSPDVWGVGWGNQDVRGEDIGTDCDGQLTDPGDQGPYAIQSGLVNVAKNFNRVAPSATSPPSWPATLSNLIGGTFFVWPGGTTFDTADPNNDVYTIIGIYSGELILNRPYTGADASDVQYRIIEPTQADGILESGEDVGADGLPADQLDDNSGIPNNVSDNDGTTMEYSIGEGNKRLDSRVMGIWDSRSSDPRNPRKAAELNGSDDNSNQAAMQGNGIDDDFDGVVDDKIVGTDAAATPEGTSPTYYDNNYIDDDGDGVVDDRSYEPAGKPEGIDEPEEADTIDDSLPKAVRITIAMRDPQQSLKPVVLGTTVWLSTAK